MAALSAAAVTAGGLRPLLHLRRRLGQPMGPSDPLLRCLPFRRYCLPQASSTQEETSGGGRTVGLSLSAETSGENQGVVDVNPPRGTRDFPPEDMRLRNWLFRNFREVSQLFAFEEVDFPVLESEALFTRKAAVQFLRQRRPASCSKTGTYSFSCKTCYSEGKVYFSSLEMVCHWAMLAI